MVDQNLYYRHILLFYFKQGKNASQAFNKVWIKCTERMQFHFVRVKLFPKILENSHREICRRPSRTGRPTEIETDKIKVLLDENPCLTARNIAEDLQISHTSVLNHIHEISYVNRLNAWVPHALTETQLARRSEICDSLIRHEKKNHRFLKSLETGDEKWIVYNNLKRKKSWGSPSDPPHVTPKTDLHQEKVMLSIWWDWKGILYFKPFPPSRKMKSYVYHEQLDKLKKEIEKKKKKRPELINWKDVVFHHDNARPHTSLKT